MYSLTFFSSSDVLWQEPGPSKSHMHHTIYVSACLEEEVKHTCGLAGEAHGRLVAVDRIEAGALPEGSSDPVILLVKEASGDEEVGAAGANLKGVILSHSLPHLSHLGELLASLN